MFRSVALKRVMDVAGAAIGILLLWPVLALIALAVRITMGSPVLFRQERIGYRNRPFMLVKFRSMPVLPPGCLPHPGEVRLPRVGAWLRKTGLDELPELFCVLTGRMSLVGPRPLLPEYLPLYTAEHLRRHDVLPGITGLAQITGRQALPLSQRFASDVHYVDHWNLGMDIHILMRTVAGVFFHPGAEAPPVSVEEVDDLGFSRTLGLRS